MIDRTGITFSLNRFGRSITLTGLVADVKLVLGCHWSAYTAELGDDLVDNIEQFCVSCR
jgi:Pyruvate/2-oxoacid:ferredoxin oxidoreductase gamma subunit